MRDVRELILLRLLAILNTVDGAVSIGRDRADYPPEECPALVLLDNREEKRTVTRGSKVMPPAVMVMQPQIWIQIKPRTNVTNDGVGEELSAFRVKVLAAIFADQELAGLQGENGELEYIGSETDMVIGSDLTGNLLVTMNLTYLFDPADLS